MPMRARACYGGRCDHRVGCRWPVSRTGITLDTYALACAGIILARGGGVDPLFPLLGEAHAGVRHHTMKYAPVKGIQPPQMPRHPARGAPGPGRSRGIHGAPAGQVRFHRAGRGRCALRAGGDQPHVFLGSRLTSARLFDVRAVTCDLSGADWRGARYRRVELESVSAARVFNSSRRTWTMSSSGSAIWRVRCSPRQSSRWRVSRGASCAARSLRAPISRRGVHALRSDRR